MSSPMYPFAVPVFKQMLMALKAVLAQASTHASTHSIEPDALLQARGALQGAARLMRLASAKAMLLLASAERKRREPLSQPKSWALETR